MAVKANVDINKSKLFNDALSLLQKGTDKITGDGKLSELGKAVGQTLTNAYKGVADTMTEVQKKTGYASTQSLKYDKKVATSQLAGVRDEVVNNSLKIVNDNTFNISKNRLGEANATTHKNLIETAAATMYDKNAEDLGKLMPKNLFQTIAYNTIGARATAGTDFSKVTADEMYKVLESANMVDFAGKFMNKLNKGTMNKIVRRDKFVTPIVQGAANMVESGKVTADDLKLIGIGAARSAIPVGGTAIAGTFIHNKIEEKKGNRYYGY